ncbi:Metallophosphoesterase domain containing protein [Aphelenchoides avenae]|nr:Metallophosphoesterase domain containing protein [Aphelenchus avenae]
MLRLALAALSVTALVSSQTGRILQLSDFHYDTDYSVIGDADQMCHELKNGSPVDDTLGSFGDYKCDSPKNAVSAAKETLPNPDLILWTGDNVPHIKDNTYDDEYVASNFNFTTSLLKASFPNTTLLPIFGNHDYAPANAFPDNGSSTYARVFQLWQEWIGPDANGTFLRGGYYKFTWSGGVTFLMLNTNLYYRFNKAQAQFADKTDPAGQFKFMIDTLEEAKLAGRHVHVVSHIAPGVFERTPNFTWMTPEYNRRFLNITRAYASTIKWMIFGHHHTDTFHIVKAAPITQTGSNNAVQLMLMCPAVTPWFSDLDGAGANNPAFRVIEYDSKSWDYRDIKTYYVNLDVLNKDKSTKWKLEYSMKDAYNLSAINAGAMQQLLERFKEDDTVFGKYVKYNSVLWKPKLPEGKYR